MPSVSSLRYVSQKNNTKKKKAIATVTNTIALGVKTKQIKKFGIKVSFECFILTHCRYPLFLLVGSGVLR